MNQDVLKIIQAKKLFHTHVVVTSRPHSTKDIQKYFDTIFRVDGFTHIQAKQFSLKVLSDENKVKDVLKYNPAKDRQNISLSQCPILLSFLCLLVKEGDIDLSKDVLNSGEIYTRMVRRLYKKFTIQTNTEFEASSLYGF